MFSRSGLTRPQCVKFYTGPFVVLQNLPDRIPVLARQRSVHESTDGPSNDCNTRPDNVCSYCEPYDRIEALPPCQRYQTHASNRSDRGPHVCEQMAGICFERYGVSLGPDASQYCSYAKVHKGRRGPVHFRTISLKLR